MLRLVVKEGDAIKIDYTVRLENGVVMGSTFQEEPGNIIVGKGEIMPGMDKALIGMKEGESGTIKLECKDAYGTRQSELVQEIERCFLPSDYNPVVGHTLELRGEDEIISAKIIDVSEKSVKIDANHLLAGKDVIVDFRIVEITPSEKMGKKTQIC